MHIKMFVIITAIAFVFYYTGVTNALQRNGKIILEQNGVVLEGNPTRIKANITVVAKAEVEPLSDSGAPFAYNWMIDDLLFETRYTDSLIKCSFYGNHSTTKHHKFRLVVLAIYSSETNRTMGIYSRDVRVVDNDNDDGEDSYVIHNGGDTYTIAAVIGLAVALVVILLCCAMILYVITTYSLDCCRYMFCEPNECKQPLIAKQPINRVYMTP